VRAELTATCPGCEVGIGFGAVIFSTAPPYDCRRVARSTRGPRRRILDQFAAFLGFVVGEPTDRVIVDVTKQDHSVLGFPSVSTSPRNRVALEHLALGLSNQRRLDERIGVAVLEL